jgi:myo-inositol 2-dehydrogenase / D-chiro-inositol 1-dehydrogenase
LKLNHILKSAAQESATQETVPAGLDLHGPASRRDLLTGALASRTAASIIVPAQAVRGSRANSSITVGLIGAGGRGSFDAGIANADPRARVTALCDLYDDNLERAVQTIKASRPAIFKDFEKLLASDVDAVIIATPPFEHPRMLAAAIQAGKHVYCEKPMGVDTAGCRAVITAGRRADPRLCISTGFQQRHAPVYLEAYRRLRTEQIGRMASARGWWMSINGLNEHDWSQRYPSSDAASLKLRHWFAFNDYSGDIIVEQDCHIFDVLCWFLGALPVRAMGWGGRRIRTWVEILDHASILFEFPEGLHVTFEANQVSPPGYRRVGEEFTGTGGVIATTRSGFVHTRGQNQVETVNSKRDPTIDAIEVFLGRIVSGNVENVAERSALTTMMAILGRTAVYRRREVTWKEEFSN